MIFLGAALLPLSAGQPQRRLRGNIESNQTFTLTGNTRPSLAHARDQGEAGPALPLTSMTLHFTLSAAQLADQQQLQKQQLTRRTSQYHKWLTPEQYGDRFGVNSADLEQIGAWLAREGFSDIEVARSRTAVSFSGNAAQVQAAFHTPIHHYLVNGESHYAGAGDPVLPKAMQGMVAGISGLDDMHPKPRVRPHLTSSSNGKHYLLPDDFATIYDLQPLYGAGIDGSGQTIAIVGQSDIKLSDIEAFRTAAGLPPRDPQIILAGTDPGMRPDDEIESDLDIEWAGGIARNAAIIFVNSPNVFYSLYYAIENNVAPVISISYSECEANLGSANSNSLNGLLQQANMQGITVVADSGDWGPAGCDHAYPVVSGLAVNLPASSPYATAMGGTTFNEGAGIYWNSTTMPITVPPCPTFRKLPGTILAFPPLGGLAAAARV
jgi:subtilase family serine protease